ncbi:MAG: hypothetical protein AAF184_17570 [Pseudomonadota bacterium]
MAIYSGHARAAWRTSVILCLGALTGCTSLSGQIGQNAVDYNHAVADMATQVAFLNVLRARERLPRSYTALSQIQGNLNATVGGEVALTTPLGDSEMRTFKNSGGDGTVDEVFSYAGPSLAPKLTGSITSDPNFTVAVLATQEFYQGILRPLSVSQVALFLSQGWRSDMIAHLMIESVRFEFEDGTLLEVVNDPASELWRAAANSFTLYAKKTSAQSVPLGSLNGAELASLVEQGLVVSASGGAYQIAHPPGGVALGLIGEIDTSIGVTRKSIKVLHGKCLNESDVVPAGATISPYQDCLNDYLPLVAKSLEGGDILLRDGASSAGQLPLFPQASYRYQNAIKVGAGMQELSGVTLITRNTDGVIYAVGEYLRSLKRSPINSVFVGCAPSGTACTDQEGSPIFVVRSGSANKFNGELVSGVLNGERWYVPTDAGRSMQVLSLIDQLVNLNKASETLPTPTFIRVQ